MAKSYYCGVCRTSSPPGNRTEAERERDQHREQVHGGWIPTGEEIRTVDREPFNYRSAGQVILIFLLLPVADWLWRHL
jgi:hypothetical protein